MIIKQGICKVWNTGVKFFGEEVKENVDVIVDTYKDFKFQELNSIYSDKGYMELFQRPDYTIMKNEDNLVKHAFPLTRFYPWKFIQD